MRIVVAGLPKSGTTALYFKLRNSLAGTTSCHFECHAAPEVAPGSCDHVLVKILYRGDPEQAASYRDYDRRIVILRDPRDRLVSAVLYGAGMHGNYATDDAKVEAVASLLRRKEAGEDVALLDIIDRHRACSGQPPGDPGSHAGLADAELGIVADLDDWFRFRYDALAAGDFAALERHLGCRLRGTADVDADRARVVRTKGSGSWRHWFTARDVAHFAPLLGPVVDALGWDPDWTPAAAPAIDPRHGSQYYLRLVAEARQRAEAERSRREAPDFEARRDETLARLMGPEWVARRRRGDR